MHIYILAVGIFIGIILGPGVLGKISPSTYSAMFSSAQSQRLTQIASSIKQQTKNELSHIKQSKLTLNELKAKLTGRNQKLASLNIAIAQAHDRRATHLLTALFIALAVIMLVEALNEPIQKTDSDKQDEIIISPIIGKLLTIRYALIAGGLAVILSRPQLPKSPTLILAIIIIALVFVLGIAPLGKRKKV